MPGAGRGNRAKVNPDAIEFVREIWTRAYQAHLALENVEQLWELIKTPIAEESTQPREARIVPPQFGILLPLVHRLSVGFQILR